MFRRERQFVAFGLCLALAGCGRGGAGAALTAEAAAGYLAPPQATAARRQDGGVMISGTAAPRATVQLSTPTGQRASAQADGAGRWEVALPPGPARIFGLSMTAGGRRTQAQGYLLVGPAGEAALLRAGAGALRLDPRRPGIGAFDFDSRGGAVVSGGAPADSVLAVRVDGRHAADSRADPDGRFSIILPQLPAGTHRIEVDGDGFDDAIDVDATPAAALADGPLHSQLNEAGLRADWLTPGGGVQSTLIAG